MKRWAIGFFLCYPLLPVGFICGMGLFERKPFALVAILYYALLLACTWNLRRLGGWAGRWYALAFAITCLHLSCVGGMLLQNKARGVWGGGDDFIGLILVTIPGVYVAATWAGAALAFGLKRRWEGVIQLCSPLLMLLGIVLGKALAGPLVILTFGGQALDALLLSFRLVNRVEQEDFYIGLSPSGLDLEA